MLSMTPVSTSARCGGRRTARMTEARRHGDLDDEGWFDGPRTSGQDLLVACKAVERINAASDKMAGLAAKSGGSSIYGHRNSVRINKALNRDLNALTFSNGKKVAEEFAAAGHTLVNNHYLKLIKAPSPGLAKLCLCRVDGWGRLPVITKVLAGGDVLHRDHPLFACLVHDGGRYYVDASKDGTAGNEEGDWNAWRMNDELARLGGAAHYWLEYLMLLPLAMVAKAVDAQHLLGLAAAWVLVEWSADWQTVQRAAWSRAEPDASASQPDDPRQAALDRLLQGFPFSIRADCRWLPAAEYRERMAGTIRKALAPAMDLLTARNMDNGGALPARQAGNLAIALGGDVPRTLADELHALNQASAPLARQVGAALRKSMKLHARADSGPVVRTYERRPVEPADLLAIEPVRNLAAMELVQSRYWSPFVEGFAHLYESETERPGAPMPHAGVLPLSLRLAAAAGSTLLARTLAGKVQLPDAVFAADTFLVEGPDLDVRKQIHAHVKNNFIRYLAFQDVVAKAEGSATPDAWLTWVEYNCLYAGGCGVDSVSALIFPAFFFSDLKFDRLLRHEDEHFKRIWRAVRTEIATLYPLYKRRDMIGLKQRFARLFEKVRDLNLRHAESIEPADEKGAPPTFLTSPAEDPFAAPSNVFTREHLVLDEANAPIEYERLGGGNPAALQHMIQRLTPYITLLRRLHAQPFVALPRLRGRFSNGLDFDMDRLDAVMVGETEAPFLSVDHRPAPRPDVRYTVRILVDFSGSMGKERVGLAKDFALALSLGLRNFDVVLYFYSTKGSFYQLIEVFDSRRRKLGGLGALASICDNKYDSGWGWNPDAACLLAIRALMDREPGIAGRRNLLVYLGDMEFCSSLKAGIAGHAAGEVAYAARKLLADGHRLIIGRCGTDHAPFHPDEIPHAYFHLPETGIDHPTVRLLYRLIHAQVSDIERCGAVGS